MNNSRQIKIRVHQSNSRSVPGVIVVWQAMLCSQPTLQFRRSFASSMVILRLLYPLGCPTSALQRSLPSLFFISECPTSQHQKVPFSLPISFAAFLFPNPHSYAVRVLYVPLPRSSKFLVANALRRYSRGDILVRTLLRVLFFRDAFTNQIRASFSQFCISSLPFFGTLKRK